MKKYKLSMRTRESLTGLFYLTPFLIGVCVFFLFPVGASFVLSFGDLDPESLGFRIIVKGWQHYIFAFTEDAHFVPLLISTARKTLIEAPLIVIFSLILAILLSKVRKMSGFFRVVLLLPFVLGTGEVMNQLISQGVDTRIISLTNSEIIPREWLLYIGSDFVTVLDTLFSSIIRILWQSSVQIVLFLSAILGISPALYESAKIDGANAYETFWKITLPMVSPVLLLNMIYTIIASFTDGSNRMLEFISDYMLKYGNHGYAAALGWVYFVMVLLIIGVVALVLGRYVKANQGYGGKR